MAIIREIKDQAGFDAWIASRPPDIQAMIRQYPPNRLYWMKESGHRCTIVSYAEDGTVRVSVTGQYNRVLFGRDVFGVPLSDLEECALPGPDEDVGDTSAEAGYTKDDIENILLPKLRRDMARRN